MKSIIIWISLSFWWKRSSRRNLLFGPAQPSMSYVKAELWNGYLHVKNVAGLDWILITDQKGYQHNVIFAIIQKKHASIQEVELPYDSFSPSNFNL